MRAPIAACAAAVFAFLGGCAGPQPSQAESWWKLEESSFSFLVPDKTTKDEVQSKVGAPLMVSNFSRQGEIVWDYRYKNGTYVFVKELTFNEDGVLKRVEKYPDNCVMRATPCR
jgi:hypothetical protein